MRVLIVCTLYPPYVLGGAEISTQLLAEGLATAGNTVSVVTTGDKDSIEQQNGVTVYRLKNKNIYWRYPQREKSLIRKTIWHFIDIYNILYKGAIKEIVKKERPDVVHTGNLCGLSVITWDVANSLNIPIVHTLRDYYLLCPYQTMNKGGVSCEKQCTICKSYSYVKKIYSQKVNAVVGISNYILEKHLSLGYFRNASNKVVIGNSVEEITFNAIKTKTKQIGYLGRISPEKGIEFLIDAFLNTHQLGYTLLIGGDGNSAYVDSLKRKYSSDRVVFKGKVKPNEFFNEIDLLVVPSLWHEPFGRVVIEAYAHHVPVFMANNGGLRDLDYEGIGWKFETNGISQLSALLSSFCENQIVVDDKRFDYVMTAYSQDNITSSYMRLYLSTINTSQCKQKE